MPEGIVKTMESGVRVDQGTSVKLLSVKSILYSFGELTVEVI
jgi:hypothetical protein